MPARTATEVSYRVKEEQVRTREGGVGEAEWEAASRVQSVRVKGTGVGNGRLAIAP